MSERILLVEDDASLRSTLIYRLQHENYLVQAVATGEAAIDAACQETPHLILLDLMLQGIDGIAVCRKLRACCVSSQRVPIIMITARVEESDMVLGLEAGADEYVTKPFSWISLRARIRAHLRRTQAADGIKEEKLGTLDAGELHIDLDARTVTRAGMSIDLTPRLFDLLVYFVRHRGIVLTRSRLLERVWGFDYLGDSNTINVHVRWLREKIEDDPANPRFLQTVRGVGYRFTA